MSELSPDARDLVAQARKQRSELLGPSAAQRAQLRAKLAPLWAARAVQPKPAVRWRWQLGSLALIVGLGLLGWLSTQSGGEGESSLQLKAASTSSAVPAVVALPAREVLASATQGVEETAAALPSGMAAPVDARRTAATSQPCAAGHALRSGACAPVYVRPQAPGPQLAAAASRKPKRLEPAATQPSGAGFTYKHQPKDEAQAEPASESDVLLDLGLAADAPESIAAGGPGARRRAQPAANERAARLPLKAAEDRTPERTVQTDANPAPPSIDGELELLGAAQAALQKQRPSRALSLLQEHAFRFPTGAMVEERMAMQALALCSLQRRQAAQTVLTNLAARGSQSQLLPRVRQQCGL